MLILALMPLLVLSSIQGVVEYEQQREREFERLHSTALAASEAVATAFSRAEGMTGAIRGPGLCADGKPGPVRDGPCSGSLKRTTPSPTSPFWMRRAGWSVRPYPR